MSFKMPRSSPISNSAAAASIIYPPLTPQSRTARSLHCYRVSEDTKLILKDQSAPLAVAQHESAAGPSRAGAGICG
jgi:hypothetical protein